MYYSYISSLHLRIKSTDKKNKERLGYNIYIMTVLCILLGVGRSIGAQMHHNIHLGDV